MTIAVIGHLVLDEIHAAGGSVIHSLGGIHFPLSAFGVLAGEGDRVFPVFPVGEDMYDTYRDVLAPWPAIDTAHMTKVDDATTRVRLFHDVTAQYHTQLVAQLGDITAEAAGAAAAQADLVYANMMTGRDLTLSALHAIAARARGLFYLDLHMIAYHVAAGGHRSPSMVEDWKEWIAGPHILQCNEAEFAVLGPPGLPDEDRAALLLASGTLRRIVITRGERGATIYAADEAPLAVAPVPRETVVDSTGCGDVFGATLALYLARGASAAEAAAAAARAGAFVAGVPGSDGMHGLRRAVYGASDSGASAGGATA